MIVSFVVFNCNPQLAGVSSCKIETADKIARVLDYNDSMLDSGFSVGKSFRVGNTLPVF